MTTSAPIINITQEPIPPLIIPAPVPQQPQVPAEPVLVPRRKP